MAGGAMVGDWGKTPGAGKKASAPAVGKRVAQVYVPPPGGTANQGGTVYTAPSQTNSGPDLLQLQLQEQQRQQQEQEARAAAELAKRNQEGKDKTKRENDATAALADSQFALLAGFGKQRDTKLNNITQGLKDADATLLGSYKTALSGLQGSAKDNDAAEGDASFSNVQNAIRERGEILAEAASQGAGESDLLRAQLSALRNYTSNQSEVNRSFFDTLRSVNNAIGSLNSDTGTSRVNIFQQSEADREAAWANYFNQLADTWTQIGNIENSNTNIDTDSSTGYAKKYGQAADEAAKASKGSYAKSKLPTGWTEWDGKGAEEQRTLNSSNRAATLNLSGPQKRPEGATLRKW